MPVNAEGFKLRNITRLKIYNLILCIFSVILLSASIMLTPHKVMAETSSSSYVYTINTVAGSLHSYGGDGGPAINAKLNYPKGVVVDNIGNIYITDADCIRKVDAITGNITTIAGTSTGGYSGDGGPATAAQLNAPYGISVDSTGNIYIADSYNNRIRMVDKSTGIITTIAGNGVAGYSGDGGLATDAQLNTPLGVTVDRMDNVYISDTRNSRVRMVDKATGIISTVAGTGVSGHSGDGGIAVSAQIKSPYTVAVDNLGNIYFVDENDNCIRKVDNTKIITTLCGSTQGYSGDGGPAATAKLNNPFGIAVDSNGNVYISDTDNSRVRMVDKVKGIISTIAGAGVDGCSFDECPAAIAELTRPLGINVDSTGRIYVVDQASRSIRAISLTPPLTPPVLTTDATSIKFGQSSNLTFSDFYIWRLAIKSISIDGASIDSSQYTVSSGNINLASSVFYTGGDHSIVVKAIGFEDAIVTQNMMNPLTPPNLIVSDDDTLGHSVNLTFADDEAWRANIVGITVNGSSLNANQYTVDTGIIDIPASVFTTAGDYTVVINATGYSSATLVKTMVTTSSTANVYTINTIGGTGVRGYSGDGGSAAAANLNAPSGIAVDDEGNVYIADTNNNRVRLIERSTGKITTIAGNGTAGFSGDGGPATNAKLGSPRGVALDSLGNVYIADSGSNRIRMVDKATGVINTVAGGASDNSGDGGPAIGAGLNSPTSIAIDISGNLYISDYESGYGYYGIRMVDKTTGIISTILGNPNGVTVDGIGNIHLACNSYTYTASSRNNQVSMEEKSTGTIITIAGTGISGYSGDGGVATVAKLSGPSGVAVDSFGNIYIADTNNNRIRVLTVSTSTVIPAPALTAPSTKIIIGQSVDLSFTDDPAWRNAINQIAVDDKPLTSSQYSVSAGNINIDAGVFTTAGEHVIVVNALGYYPTVLKINITSYGDTEVSNFDITLNPYTSDYPTVTVRQHGVFASAIYGDSKGIEPVTFWFTKGSDGKYYCRYSTSSLPYYPLHGLSEFVPAATGEVLIKIFSRGRVGALDMNGISIKINNDTDLIANVMIANDDPARPRVHSIVANRGSLKGVTNLIGYPTLPGTLVLKGLNSFAPLIPFGDSSDALSKKVLSPNGQTVATVGLGSNLLQLWNTSDGTLIKTLTDHISSFVYNHDGSILVSNFKNNISIWNTSDGSLIKSIDLPYNGYSFSYISLNSDLSMLAGNSLGTVFVWDLLQGKLLSSISNVGGGDLSPDGEFLITSTSNSLRIWKTNDGTLNKEIPYNNFACTNNSFSQDGSLFITISQSQAINIWQTSDWSLAKTINIKAQSAILSPDNKLLAVYDGGQLQLVNINDGSIVSVLVQSKTINTYTFSDEGKYLAACDTNNGTKIWTVADGNQILSIPDGGTGVSYNTIGDELSIITFFNFTETVTIEASPVNPSASISIIRLKDGENFGYHDIPLFINVSSCTDLSIYLDGTCLSTFKLTGRCLNLNGYLISDSLLGGIHTIKLIATDANGNQISKELSFSTSEKVHFEKPWYSVNENAGSVQINVIRESGDSTLQVKYCTSDPGTNGRFQVEQGLLSYAEGEIVKTISIPINDNQIYDGNDEFFIYLTSDGSNSANLDWTAVTIVDDEVPETLTPPILTTDSIHNTIGQSINITFTDDPAWRADIGMVYVDGNWLDPNKLYTISPGNINFAASLFTTPGDHTIAVYANGYNDANVTQTMVALPAPVLTAVTANNYIGQSVNLAFADNAAWRAAVRGITIDSRPLSSGQYTVTSGNINIVAGVFTVPGNHTIIVKATDYYDITVIQSIVTQLVAPVLSAPTTNVSSGQPLNIAFNDDVAWRLAINEFDVDGTSLDSSQYTISAGNINIDPGVLTTEGDHKITIKAMGYLDATVTQTIVAAPSSFTDSPLAQPGTNSDNSAGIIVGLQNITDSTESTSLNPKLNRYQAEIDFDPLKVNILGVNALTTLDNFQVDRQDGKVIVSDSTSGSAIQTNMDKLFFVSLDLIGTVKDSTGVTVKFLSSTDENGNSIDVSPPAILNFQRGKIINDGTTQISISDAVAGLQYLAKLQDESQINVVNMASIIPVMANTNCIKPSVKDIIVLMQKFVGLRDDSFNLMDGL